MLSVKVEQFVTCFDSYFLPQGLALYNSLKIHSEHFVLWVVCLDQRTYDVLDEYSLPGIKLLFIGAIENDQLVSLKGSRSKAEYIWTLSPFMPKWIFEADPDIERVTYLDADMFFFGDPSLIFEEFELSGKDILITEHAFDEEYDQSTLLGRFCVQFIIYKRGGSEAVRKWWEDRCLEWCFNRWEDGKFGDQKYLDHWPILFPEKVHILKRLDYILAPWNSSRYPSSSLILWHFHGFRLLTHSRILLHSSYEISHVIDRQIYIPYAEAVAGQINTDTYSPRNCLKYSKFKQSIIFYLAAIYKTIINRKVPSMNPRIRTISLVDINKVISS